MRRTNRMSHVSDAFPLAREPSQLISEVWGVGRLPIHVSLLPLRISRPAKVHNQIPNLSHNVGSKRCIVRELGTPGGQVGPHTGEITSAGKLGGLLRGHRVARGLSQEELAARVQPALAANTISNLERGRTRPYRQTLDTLAKALSLTAAQRAELVAIWRGREAEVQGTVPASLPKLGARPNNLPLTVTPLIGRQPELATIAAHLRLPHVRLLTLTGPAGAGKTRLAVEAASNLLGVFADGVYFVALASINDPALVVSAITESLGMVDAGANPRAALREFLRDKSLLVVLDNFEHLLTAAPMVAELLAEARGLKVLVTSREPLRSRWERVYPVPSLPLPDLETLPDLAALGATPAVTLFVQRACGVRPEFQLTAENARAVAEVCVRLDGLPLAIELAAARCNVLGPQAILSRLQHRLRLLRHPAPDGPPRHQTLQAAIDWSYELLAPQERAVFRRLGVFVGGWTLEAAEVVTDTASLGVEALDVLGALVDKGLIQVQMLDSSAHESRFRMLETLREYALDQLAAAGELDATNARHVGFFVELAEVGEPSLRSAEQAVWLERLETEHDNFRAVLGCSLGSGPVTESALRLGWALGWFWFLHGHYSEGRRWLEHLLEHSPGASPLLRARLLARAGSLAYGQGDLGRAAALLQESVTLARGEGDTWLVAVGLTVWGFVAEFQGDYARGHQFTQESLALFRQLNDVWGIGWALHQLGRAAHDQGEDEQAEAYLNESLALRRAIGDSWGLVLALHYLGRVAHAQGAHTRARRLLEESLAVSRRVGFKRYIAWALHHLARVARAQGEHRLARAYEEESLASAIQRGDKPGIVECVEGLAGLAVELSDWTRAARLAGAVEAQREALGNPRPRAYHRGHERDLAAVRAALGERSFGKQWTAGRGLRLEDAVAEAREPAAAGRGSSAPPRERFDPLTGREREVAVLVARGFGSRRIAAELVIAEGTVRVHVEHILSKLDLHSRAQLASWTVQRGLLHDPG